MQKERNQTVDIAKCLGIVLMVLGHAGWVFGKFCALFNMPLFFRISGYLFNEKKYTDIQSVIKYAKRKLKSLWIPYFATITFFTVVHNLFIQLNIYTNNPEFILQKTAWNKYGLSEFYSAKTVLLKIIKTFFFAHGEILTSALWFLKVLFFVSVFSALGHFIANKYLKNEKTYKTIQGCIYTVLLLAGCTASVYSKNFYLIGTMCTCSFLFYLGICFKNVNISNFNIYQTCISFIAILLCSFYPKLNVIGTNNIYNPFILVLSSICGFVLTMYCAKLIARFKRLTEFCAYIGANTLPILCLHLLSFKIVTCLQVVYYNLSPYKLAAFPYLYNSGLWIVLYLLTGIAIPLLYIETYKKIRKRFINE